MEIHPCYFFVLCGNPSQLLFCIMWKSILATFLYYVEIHPCYFFVLCGYLPPSSCQFWNCQILSRILFSYSNSEFGSKFNFIQFYWNSIVILFNLNIFEFSRYGTIYFSFCFVSLIYVGKYIILIYIWKADS